MEKLSVIIITHNEEKNIERCLESVQWADEIVVLDSFSQDRTVELCRKYTDRVYQENWNGYGRYKNLCASKTSHKWVLNIDADEVVTPACAEEIRRELQRGPRQALYRFPRKNHIGNRWVMHGGWYPDRIARFYDKSKVAFSEPLVHEKLVPDTNAGDFVNPLVHYSYQDMTDYISRQNRYSTLSAQEMVQKGRVAGWTDLCCRPPLAFFKMFFLQQGYREGVLGLFLAVSAGFYTFLKYAKTRSVTRSVDHGLQD